jgi:23S rRNA (cytidine1920-2'-O)/16S rRNA (cytidine1409-2'-O)-methyltransferase
MPKGQRLDLILVELGLFSSREEARTAIMDGGILVGGEKVTKAGTLIADKTKVEISPSWQQKKYVSRGGLKLEKAITEFQIDCNGRIAVDIGASTGGFTDCLLKSGVAKVYAVDVGYGQLAWSLRQDARVVVCERINARQLQPSMLYEQDSPWATLAVMDVSFISLTKVLPAVLAVLDAKEREIICLIKPQFEAEKSQVGKGGVIKSQALHKEIVRGVLCKCEALGLSADKLTFSPVKGPAGNIEYLAHLVPLTHEGKPASAINDQQDKTSDIDTVVDSAFSILNAEH